MSLRNATRIVPPMHGTVLSPYSPDLNPIEQMFSKLKPLLRKADERSVDATWNRIGSLLDCFSTSECGNHLIKAGYTST